MNDKHPFHSGETRFSVDKAIEKNLIPFDDNPGLKEKIRNPRNRYWIVMVSQVRLRDGTVYDASRQVSKLERFLSESDERILANKRDLVRWESEVRTFIAELMAKPSPTRSLATSRNF